MDDWEKLNKTSLPEEEDFYSHLNMIDIIDVDYEHTKRFFKDYEEYLEILEIFLSMKKKKIIINQFEQVNLGVKLYFM